jgi:hypothetical protein
MIAILINSECFTKIKKLYNNETEVNYLWLEEC